MRNDGENIIKERFGGGAETSTRVRYPEKGRGHPARFPEQERARRQ